MTTPAPTDHRPLRWGVLGAGRILAKLGPALRRARDVEFLAIASRDRDRAQNAAREYGAARAYAGYDQLLQDADVDVVLNALHNGLHCDWTVRALRAGKHVLCEKPLAPSAAEADQMFAAARASGRWLLEGFMYRFHPQMLLARQWLDQGRIGDLVHLRAGYLTRGRERENPRYRRDAGGGALLDLGCYCVNLLRFLARAEPIRATAHAKFDPQTDIDLTLAGLLEFPGGLTGQFACSFEAEGAYSADIVGTTGRLHIPHPWRPPAWPAVIDLVRDGRSESIAVEPANLPHDLLLAFVLEIEHLAGCVRDHQPPTYPGNLDAETDSRGNARALDAVATAARTGRSVALPTAIGEAPQTR
jgi:predicted dehydrogenase